MRTKIFSNPLKNVQNFYKYTLRIYNIKKMETKLKTIFIKIPSTILHKTRKLSINHYSEYRRQFGNYLQSA